MTTSSFSFSSGQRWLLFLGAVLLSLGAAFLAANIFGRGAFFLVLATIGLLGAITLFWRSTQSLTGEAPLSLDEALSLTAPHAEEERKQAVLRVLKDLEYERAVGKIADADFHELQRKYRAEARALLATLDDELAPARKHAEQLLEERLQKEPVTIAKAPEKT